MEVKGTVRPSLATAAALTFSALTLLSRCFLENVIMGLLLAESGRGPSWRIKYSSISKRGFGLPVQDMLRLRCLFSWHQPRGHHLWGVY